MRGLEARFAEFSQVAALRRDAEERLCADNIHLWRESGRHSRRTRFLGLVSEPELLEIKFQCDRCYKTDSVFP